MHILTLPIDEQKSKELKSFMTDAMWQQVSVQYLEQDNCALLLRDGSVLSSVSDIVRYLQTPAGQRLDNAREAAIKALDSAMKTGKLRADKSTIELRRQICEACPLKKTSFLMKKCTLCGCFIKPKTLLLSESCPLQKW